MKNYSFIDTVILRTPLFKKQNNIDWENIKNIFSFPQNREALFLGSPNICNIFEMYEKDNTNISNEDIDKLKKALYKYTSRLSNRSTPFGLFSTISVVKIDSKTDIDIEKSSIQRITKLDMLFLGVIKNKLLKQEGVLSKLKFFSNNSMYKISNKYRYVEYYYKENKIFHRISEVETSEYLDLIAVKAKKGIDYEELVLTLLNDDVPYIDAVDFINTLIDNQFILSELEFTLTGQDFLDRLIKVFSEDRFQNEGGIANKDMLIKIKKELNSFDQNINEPLKYVELSDKLKLLHDDIDISKLFQVDSFRNINKGTLDTKTIKTLKTGISVLNKLQDKYENEELNQFKKKFQKRFENEEIQLVKALDTDLGISYNVSSTVEAPLLDNLRMLNMRGDNYQISLGPKKHFLLKKLIEATKKNDYIINLLDDDLNKFDENKEFYPDTFSVFINVFNESGVEKINIKSLSGPSANCLIGRFSHLNKNVFDLCDKINAIEADLNSDKIVAEIVHLPENRTGNILYRSFQRHYEIPYLGNSSLDISNQIAIDDLYLSIKNDKFYIRSKTLNKEILPRLSTAHNFPDSTLPIYSFLCALQNQDCPGFAFDWGGLQNEFDFLPRLCYKNIIFSRATWNINEKDIKKLLLDLESKETCNNLKTYLFEKKIPEVVYLCEGDNEILFNFKNELSCQVFYSMIKGKRNIQLKEFLFKEKSVTSDFCNEFILSAFRTSKNNNPNKELEVSEIEEVERSFSIGDDWLYYKFYCGEKAGEELLKRVIVPLVDKLTKKGFIKKWFFIRYNDEDGNHIRVRFLLEKSEFILNCIQHIKKSIFNFEKEQLIWKTTTDKYVRELERYGFKTIEETETLFNNDSICSLNFIATLEGDISEKNRWLFALLSVHEFLNDFDFSIKNRIELFNYLKSKFSDEFSIDSSINKEINKKFSLYIVDIENLLIHKELNEVTVFAYQLIKERSIKNRLPVSQIKSIINKQKNDLTIDNLILSYVHMICNRIFLTKQRQHEMVIYNFLHKFYNRQFFKN
ncbi:hypothetical protein OA88_12815 [Flavobacterium sp. JRM]|nr:hypothetical protein OA88_12815 [Flavobacterium sp. JRM]